MTNSLSTTATRCLGQAGESLSTCQHLPVSPTIPSPSRVLSSTRLVFLIFDEGWGYFQVLVVHSQDTRLDSWPATLPGSQLAVTMTATTQFHLENSILFSRLRGGVL